MAIEREHGRIFEFGSVQLDLSERLCLRGGQVLPLTPKAFDLLVYLVERHGHLVEKQALMHAMWPDSVVEDANLAYTVSMLRKALDDDADSASVIQTVPTRGYRFVAPVKTSLRMQADPTSDREADRLGLPQGETLAVRLTRGPLPITQVLRAGIDIADALEAAHRQGIVHGELAPGNIMLTPAGTKLLHFGDAKTAAGDGTTALSRLATATGTGIADGAILDRLSYMAPEQVQGGVTDARTDLFALGAILHEVATGRRAFEATTQTGVMAEILETDPPAVSTLMPLAPRALDYVVQSCLAKDPVDRCQTAHDVKLQLQWIQAESVRSNAAVPATVARRRTAWVLWAVAAAFGALVATTLMRSSGPLVSLAPPVRFDLILPPTMREDDGDRGQISPDGRRLVFSATVDGRQQLVLRDLASADLVVLAGTDGGRNPFWSPDSRSVGFFIKPGGQLARIPVTGGPARALVDDHGSYQRTATWGAGVILFGPHEGRIHRVVDTGGTAAALETLPWKPGQRNFTSPRFLPDGRHFMVTIEGDPALYVGSLDGQGTRKIMEDGSSAAYAADHLFYSRGTGVFARPFDPKRLVFSGPEVQVTAHARAFSVSDRGTIIYRPERGPMATLTWFDRSGGQAGTVGESGEYGSIAMSPRARRATVVRSDENGNVDLWDADLASGIFSRLTTDPEPDRDPAWSPDERALAFTSWRTGRAAAFVKDLVTGNEEPLVGLNEEVVVDEWTADGRFVIIRTPGKAVYAVPLSGDRTPRMLVDPPFVEDQVHLSPDGRWVAFNANESGRWEVYIAPFPAFTPKRQISSGGGVQPQWRADGRELFYLGPDGSMMSVRVDTRTGLAVTPASGLFTTRIAATPYTPQYAVTADGHRFLGLQRAAGSTSFTVLLNWLNRPMGGAP